MKKTTILITSGGCLEKWDNVRGHTNLAKGTIGKLMAEKALDMGANVIYLHGYFSVKPKAENQQNLTLQSFEGIEDLQEKMRTIILNQCVDVVIMAAAGSDWIVDYMSDKNGQIIPSSGKLSSDNPPVIHFKKAPKVLRQIKSWNSKIILVGFKLESNFDKKLLVERAEIRMKDSFADYMIANSSNSLYANNTIHYILDKDKNVIECANKDETSKEILKLLESKIKKN